MKKCRISWKVAFADHSKIEEYTRTVELPVDIMDIVRTLREKGSLTIIATYTEIVFVHQITELIGVT
jgi:phosphoserine phosphatase